MRVIWDESAKLQKRQKVIQKVIFKENNCL